MNEQHKWVVSPRSMAVLNTPLMDYFHSAITADYGKETADRTVIYTYHYCAGMDEGEPESEIEKDLAFTMYPLLGIYQGFLREGMAPDAAHDYLMSLWEKAPAELKERPWAEAGEE